MPEQHDEKRPIQLHPIARAPGSGRQYAELHCKTNFSFLEGASHPDELVNRAAELDYAALAITDRNSLAGVVRAHGAAKQVGLKLLIGAEITPDDACAAVLLATDRRAYGQLARLITVGRRNAPKGECQLTFHDLAEHAEGLLACVVEPHTDVSRYREVFGDRCYLLTALHYGSRDEEQLDHALRLAKQARVPVVAAGGVHFHHPDRRPLADVLTATRAGCTVVEAAELLLPNAERHLKSPQEMAELFARVPAAVRRTIEIADRCTFSLDDLRYEYPEELAPRGESLSEYLARLTWEGAKTRYPAGITEKVRQLIEHELRIIGQLHYEAYFLTVWDLVCFARSRGILCQGRGSAANSTVCFCLGVTAVDPDRMEVLFERFISVERNEAPDIDIDFEHERREEVLQYLYEKYGRERAGIVAEVITYRPKSAVRDVGKALGLSLDGVDRFAKLLDSYHAEKTSARLQQAGLDTESLIGQQLQTLVGQLVGFPRHLGQHVGGMVMTQGPLCELVPIENAAMPGRTVIEWDKDDLDELGILKVDCLSLGMLTAIRKSFELIHQHGGPELTLADIPEGDKPTYEMISRADTMGVFQIESRAQMSMLPRLKPECFYDLVIEVAIVRPGPIQGNMVHPYLRRRAGEEQVTYPNPEIGEVLKNTLGVPLFQEQAMRLAVVAAGFTPGEADQLRRAMAGWRRPGLIGEFRKKLIEGMLAKGLTPEFAECVFNQIKGFGEYGFPESHAASFALLAYASAWLKCHYPAAFCAALLNSQPMGFYAPAQLVRNAQEHGVTVLPVDVNHSDWDCTLEQGALRLGLRSISGLSQLHGDRIAQTRPFRSIADFGCRSELGKSVIKLLASADAFQSVALDRRQALWQSLAQEKQLPLLAGLDDDENLPTALPQMSGLEQVLADYRTKGMSLRAHPISFFREQLDSLHITPAAKLADTEDGTFVRVAGLVLVRQRPSTAKGITFVTLEDETGVANLIIKVDVWERYYQVARTASSLIASGRLQHQKGVIHVLVAKMEHLAGRVGEMKSQSRDFH
ncbi:error-prone DNA polymerase [Anatilimnocola sp. NA78]|uniref:error-prone DNA polymerase n=1 Tax=Anatilimnocola sp. NA78 TaxID=3415683 RepID=UPI003CE5A63D